MKIQFLLSHDEAGGARNLWEQVAEGLAGRGHATALAAIYRKDRSIPNPWQVLQGHALRASGLAAAIWRVAKHLRKEQPTAIVAAQPAANIVGALAGWMAGVPVRIISHHTPLHSYEGPQRHLDRWIGCLPAVTRIVCVSEGVKSSLNGYPKAYLRKVVVIRNAVPPEVAQLTGRLAALPRATAGSGLKIVAAGRLAEQKNYPTLIRALSQAPGCQLHILGDGPDRAALESLAQSLGTAERVHFHGHMAHNDALHFMAGCDVFVQPSLFEGHSVALLEAASLGLPLVVSDVPTQTEALRGDDGRLHGEVAPVLDAQAFAAIFCRLERDPQARAAMRNEALALAAKAGFDTLLDNYEGLLADRGCAATDGMTV